MNGFLYDYRKLSLSFPGKQDRLHKPLLLDLPEERHQPSLQRDPTSEIMDWKFQNLGNAEVKFPMLMLAQAQLNLTCPFYVICLDTHFVMELKIESIYLLQR